MTTNEYKKINRETIVSSYREIRKTLNNNNVIQLIDKKDNNRFNNFGLSIEYVDSCIIIVAYLPGNVYFMELVEGEYCIHNNWIDIKNSD